MVLTLIAAASIRFFGTPIQPTPVPFPVLAFPSSHQGDSEFDQARERLQRYLNNGQFREAAREYEAAKLVMPKNTPHEALLRAEFLSQGAEAYAQIDGGTLAGPMFAEALRHLDSAPASSPARAKAQIRQKVFSGQARFAVIQGRYGDAEDAIDAAETIGAEIKDPLADFRLYQEKATLAYFRNNMVSAKIAANQLIEIAKRFPDRPQLRTIAFYCAGAAHYDDPPAAYRFYKEASKNLSDDDPEDQVFIGLIKAALLIFEPDHKIRGEENQKLIDSGTLGDLPKALAYATVSETDSILGRHAKARAGMESAFQSLKKAGVSEDALFWSWMLGASAKIHARVKEWPEAIADWQRSKGPLVACMRASANLGDVAGRSVSSNSNEIWQDAGWLLEAPGGKELLAESVVQFRGTSLDAQIRLHQGIEVSETEPKVDTTTRALREVSMRLVTQFQSKDATAKLLAEYLEKEREWAQSMREAGRTPPPLSPPSLRDVQRKLAKGNGKPAEAVQFVEIGPNDVKARTLYALHITRNKVAWHRLGSARSVVSQVEEWRKAMDTGSFPIAGYDAKKPLRALYRTLFAKVFQGRKLPDRLYLVPDGALGGIGFATLIDGKGVEMLDSTELVVLSSLRDLTVPQVPRASGPAVAIVAPNYPSEKRATLESPKLVAGETYPSLDPFAALTKAIKPYDPKVKTFPGLLANRDNLMAVDRPRALVIAAHGDQWKGHRTANLSVDPVSTLVATYLVLSKPPKETDERRALFTAMDASTLRLRGTEVVFISSCVGGRSIPEIGEGQIGLRRAFRSAGARHVVAAVSRIPTPESAKLVEAFFRHIGKGKTVPAALREAQREIRRTTPHPHFWGSFVAEGIS